MKTILLAFLLAATGAHARLGETVDECKTRYGEAYINEDKEFPNCSYGRFSAAGYTILITFHEGRCEDIRYEKREGAFSNEELKFLLSKNSAQPWSAGTKVISDRYGAPREVVRWWTKDGCVADFATIPMQLWIQNAARIRRDAENEAAKIAKKKADTAEQAKSKAAALNRL